MGWLDGPEKKKKKPANPLTSIARMEAAVIRKELVHVKKQIKLAASSDKPALIAKARKLAEALNRALGDA